MYYAVHKKEKIQVYKQNKTKKKIIKLRKIYENTYKA